MTTVPEEVAAAVTGATGRRPKGWTALGGGCVAPVRRICLDDGSMVVAKLGDADSALAVEAFMLDYLATNTRLPVPTVLFCNERLLLMTYVETSGRITDQVQAHAAELLSELHGISAPCYGFERDTLIGPLCQPNPQSSSWLDFFREQRLLSMARCALEAGALPGRAMSRIETLAGWLPRWIEEPAAPSLIHGDMWAGNVLCRDGRVTAFIDPAIYFADAEIELAFSTLFSTFGRPFFAAYERVRPLRPGFFEARRDLYNLYPLLVHVRLFGASYLPAVDRILARFGA